MNSSSYIEGCSIPAVDFCDSTNHNVLRSHAAPFPSTKAALSFRKQHTKPTKKFNDSPQLGRLRTPPYRPRSESYNPQDTEDYPKPIEKISKSYDKSNIMSTASRKRKLEEPQKHYAVRAGHKPGVYTSWPECQENITGFKGASYKSFLSEQDAKDFVAGKVVAGPSARDRTQGDKFYGVAVGKVPGVYEEWTEAQKQILDVKGPKYKKFATRTEAEEFVRTGGKSSVVGKADAAKKGDNKHGESSQPVAKKARNSTDTISKGKPIVVYTDGSSLGNGKVGSLAGVGAFFGVGDKRNVSEPLEGEPQTNQRAELTALQRALEIVPRDRDVRIFTDSQYSINCITAWYRGWVKKDWKTSGGGPVMNKDLVVKIRALIDERDAKGVITDIEWVRGHSNDPGNEAADQLANAGARMPRHK